MTFKFYFTKLQTHFSLFTYCRAIENHSSYLYLLGHDSELRHHADVRRVAQTSTQNCSPRENTLYARKRFYCNFLIQNT